MTSLRKCVGSPFRQTLGMRDTRILWGVRWLSWASLVLVCSGSAGWQKCLDGKRIRMGDGCWHVYLDVVDVGSNIGVQVRKLFEPHLYPGAPVLYVYESWFRINRWKPLPKTVPYPHARHNNLTSHIWPLGGNRIQLMRTGSTHSRRFTIAKDGASNSSRRLLSESPMGIKALSISRTEIWGSPPRFSRHGSTAVRAGHRKQRSLRLISLGSYLKNRSTENSPQVRLQPAFATIQ